MTGSLSLLYSWLPVKAGVSRMAKQHQALSVGALWADLPSEQTLKRALFALQRGPIRFRRNHVIACEGDTADYIFLVVSGVVRRCKTFQNGERSVVAFYLPGNLFGWDNETHPLSIEAASDVMVMFIKRRGLTTLAEGNARLAGFLRSVILDELQRAQQHAATISMSVKGRLLAFLQDWSKRSGTPGRLHLPIGYQDIADHLGIKIETLSRTITELEQSGLLTRSPPRGTLTLRRQLPAF
jgi:CRP/FNR family nitrogen fixation transcriptional regulator